MNGQYNIGDVVLGTWKLTQLIGEGGFGRVYEAEREDFGRVYKAAIKIITIPQSKDEVKSARAEGMDDISLVNYFRSFAEELVREFDIMSRLKGTANVVSYEDHAVVEHKDDIGWDIIIRMELLIPLMDYLTQKPPTRKDVINLGIDICKALELCQKLSIVHRDIKSGNIFVSEFRDFKLGDFGIARTVEKTTSGLSKKGTYTYMAPEVYSGAAYGPSVDIYSLGLVLYRLLNNNRAPFLPDYPTPITHSDRETGLAKRLSGEKLPSPKNADGRLAEIVLKACAFEPEHRYSSPAQMRQELEAILYSKEEASIIYPKGDEVPMRSLGYVETSDSANQQKPDGSTEQYQNEMQHPKANLGKKPNKLILIGAGLVAVLVLVIALIVLIPSDEYNQADAPPIDATVEPEPAPVTAASEPDIVPEFEEVRDILVPERRSVAAAGNYTVAIRADGRILTAGIFGKPIYNAELEIGMQAMGFTHIKKIAGSGSEFAILHTNGSVSTTLELRDLDRFQNIVDVDVGSHHIIALKEDGSVLASGSNMSGAIDVDDWQNIISVYAGPRWSVGLRADGTVVATGENFFGQIEVDSWRNVESIVIGRRSTFGITSDGSILSTGRDRWLWDYPVTLSNFDGSMQIADGSNHTVGLLPDGTVIAEGSNSHGQLNVDDWTDIIQIGASCYATFGLRYDGTIVATGDYATFGLQVDLGNFSLISGILVTTEYFAIYVCDLLNYTAIWGRGFYPRLCGLPFMLERDNQIVKDLATGDNFVAVLIDDGTIYNVRGDISNGQSDAEYWTSIVTIEAGSDFILGLKGDGTVVSTSPLINVDYWNDIIAIEAGDGFALGLKSDGTVVSAGINGEEFDFYDWSDIVAVAAGNYFAIGLKADGTCVVIDPNERIEGVERWTGITQIVANGDIVVGVREDGTVAIAGSTGFGEDRIDVGLWIDIVDIAVGEGHVVGVRSDGTLLASGRNHVGQIDVSDWRLWLE